MALNQTSVVIASGASLSGAVDLTNYKLLAIVMPSAWTGTAITFAGAATPGLADVDPSSYLSVVDDTGTEVSVTAAASKYISLLPAFKLEGVRWLKVRSGTSGSPVTQAADRTITLVLGD